MSKPNQTTSMEDTQNTTQTSSSHNDTSSTSKTLAGTTEVTVFQTEQPVRPLDQTSATPPSHTFALLAVLLTVCVGIAWLIERIRTWSV